MNFLSFLTWKECSNLSIKDIFYSLKACFSGDMIWINSVIYSKETNVHVDLSMLYPQGFLRAPEWYQITETEMWWLKMSPL